MILAKMRQEFGCSSAFCDIDHSYSFDVTSSAGFLLLDCKPCLILVGFGFLDEGLAVFHHLSVSFTNMDTKTQP
jgi:hypothetical protein